MSRSGADMEAWRRRLYALVGCDESALDVTSWWRVLDGYKLSLRRGPGLEFEVVEGRFLVAKRAFLAVKRVTVKGACAGGGSQVWLRLVGDEDVWAFAVNRRTGRPVATRVTASEGLGLVSERLKASKRPKVALEVALRAAVLSPVESRGGLVTRLSALYAAVGWVPTSKGHTKGLLVSMEPSEIAALRARGGGGDPPYEFFREGCGARATVPRFDVGPGCALPERARQMLRTGVACVLRNSKLLPAAELKWGNVEYLRRELGPQRCQVLSVPEKRKDFAYIRSRAKGPMDKPDGPYKQDEHVEPLDPAAIVPDFTYVTFEEYYRGVAGRCCYLQQPICQPTGTGSMKIPDGIGKEMCADVNSLNNDLIRTLHSTCNLGPWAMMQLFVGNSTMAPRARTTLHYDHVDNFYLQVSGTKTFRLFDPSQTANLAPYAFHTELDRRSRVNLDSPTFARDFPHAAAAARADVTLGPGDLLFLPCWWWHEVCTDYDADAPKDDLTTSLSFWFDIQHRMLEPPFPLRPDLRSELGRQLEIALSEWLHDSRLVKPFLSSFRKQLLAIEQGADVERALLADDAPDGSDDPGASWPQLQEDRPKGVTEARWAHLFEFIVFKLILVVGDHGVMRWLRETREYPES